MQVVIYLRFLIVLGEVSHLSQLLAVSVKVKQPSNLVVVLVCFHQKLPKQMTLDAFVGNFSLPASIQVVAQKIGPRVSVNNSVNVDHRYNHEGIFSQNLKGSLALGKEKPDDMLANERANSFARMLTSCNNDDMLAWPFFAGNFDKGNSVSYL